jgi:hypothetical protein
VGCVSCGNDWGKGRIIPSKKNWDHHTVIIHTLHIIVQMTKFCPCIVWMFSAQSIALEKKLISNASFHNLSVGEQRSQLPMILPAAEMEEMRAALDAACQYASRVVGSMQHDMLGSALQAPIDVMKWAPLMITEETIFSHMNPDMIHTHITPPAATQRSHSGTVGSADMDSPTASLSTSPAPEAFLASSPMAPGGYMAMASSPSRRSRGQSDELGMGDLSLHAPRRSRGSSWDIEIPKDDHNRHLRVLFLQKNTAEVHLELAILEAGTGHHLHSHSHYCCHCFHGVMICVNDT